MLPRGEILRGGDLLLAADGHMQNLFRFDAPTIEANRASWVERWSKTIAK